MSIREFAIREGYMKVSIDAILQSAKQLKNTNSVDEQKSGNKHKVSGDKVSLEHKVLARLDDLHNQIKDIQTTLSRYQVIDEGIRLIIEDNKNGGNNKQSIINSTLYNNRPVLKEYLGDSSANEYIVHKQEQVKNLITDSISHLNRLQVEFENIMASDVARTAYIKDKVDAIDALIPRNVKNPSQLHHVHSDSVLRLVQ